MTVSLCRFFQKRLRLLFDHPWHAHPIFWGLSQRCYWCYTSSSAASSSGSPYNHIWPFHGLSDLFSWNQSGKFVQTPMTFHWILVSSMGNPHFMAYYKPWVGSFIIPHIYIYIQQITMGSTDHFSTKDPGKELITRHSMSWAMTPNLEEQIREGKPLPGK